MNNKRLLMVVFGLFSLAATADEYIDPSTNVVYTYNPDSTTAEVKSGIVIGWEKMPEYVAGSPNVSGDVVILEKIKSNGKEFSVTKIGDYAFCMLDDLIHVSVPSSVRTIGVEAFAGCSRLVSIDMKEGLREICRESFRGCISLKSISLPSGLMTIGSEAFSGCQELTSINIPANVSEMHVLSFWNCNSLGAITVEEGNSIYDSRYNCNAVIRTADNMLLMGCKNTVIPNTINAIGKQAFLSCKGLTEIVIPESVREIGESAFSNCSNLRILTLSEGLQVIDRSAFWMCGLTAVTIPASVREIEPGAFWMSELTSLTSLIEEPFEMNMICNLDAYQTTLYVPAGAIEKYRATPDWDQFTEIQEVNTNKIGTVPSASDNFSETLFNLQGHRLSAKPQKGLYIQNGRKMVVR